MTDDPGDLYGGFINLPSGWTMTDVGASSYKAFQAAVLHAAQTAAADTWYSAQVTVIDGGTLQADGSCTGVVASFDQLISNGPHPVAAPPWEGANPEPALVDEVEKDWSTGGVSMTPLPTAYVFIPTCAWIAGSALPFGAPEHHWMYEGVSEGGIVYVLRFDLWAQANGVTWNWGDGASSWAPGPGGPGGASYGSGGWSSCSGGGTQHVYKTVGGVKVSASATVDLWATVTWDAGTGLETQAVPVAGAPVTVTLGSRTLTVLQIEGV